MSDLRVCSVVFDKEHEKNFFSFNQSIFPVGLFEAKCKIPEAGCKGISAGLATGSTARPNHTNLHQFQLTS